VVPVSAVLDTATVSAADLEEVVAGLAPVTTGRPDVPASGAAVPDGVASPADLGRSLAESDTSLVGPDRGHAGGVPGADAAPDTGPDRVGQVMRVVGHVVLAVVAGCGAVLSYASLHAAARPVFAELAYAFPVLVDALILGASLQYVAGARRGVGRAGWRLTAHAGIAGTVALNALAAFAPQVDGAAGGLDRVPWHVTAPAVWAVLVELYARQFAGDWRATHLPAARIPVRLWLTAPIESARTWIRTARHSAYASTRIEVGVHTAAREALRLALPGRDGRRVRRVLARQVRAGSLPPSAVLTACRWTTGPGAGQPVPHEVLRAGLALVLDPTSQVNPAEGSRPGPVPAGTTSAAFPTGTTSAVVPTGDGLPAPGGPAPVNPVVDLLTAGRAVAADLARAGVPLTRRALVAGLRDRGQPCSSARAGALLRELRDPRPTCDSASDPGSQIPDPQPLMPDS
jgi:hypothetical protein